MGIADMSDDDIMNIWVHMSGKAEGLIEAGGEANLPVMFARAVIAYDHQLIDAKNLASNPAGLARRDN